jgi:hypothetical protein
MYKLLVAFLLSLPLISFSQISLIELEVKYIPEPPRRDTAVDNWNHSQPGYANLPEQARQLLYWTNYGRNNPQKFWDSVIIPVLIVFPELNKSESHSLKADILYAGQLPMLSLNETLIKTAQAHASDIARKRSPLSHNSTDGTDFGTRIKRAGIRNCANENISLSSQSVLLSVLLLYLDIGLPSLGHRKTLLDKNLREIGVGSALYGKDQWFLVQDFACKQ